MSGLVYFSHSYRPRDAVVNDYFARIMDSEGFVPSLDPPSTRVNSAKLERHLNYCDAMVVVLTDREPGVSPYIRYEIALAARAQKPILVFAEDTLSSDIIPSGILQRRFSLRSYPRSLREHRHGFATLREYVGDTPPPRYQAPLTTRTCLLLGSSTIDPDIYMAAHDYIERTKKYNVVLSSSLLKDLGRHPVAYDSLREVDLTVSFNEAKMEAWEVYILGVIQGICKPLINFGITNLIPLSANIPTEYHPRALPAEYVANDVVKALADEIEIYEEDFLDLSDSDRADRYTQFLVDLGSRGQYSSGTRQRGIEVTVGDRYNIQGQTGAVGPNANVHDIVFNQIWSRASAEIDLPVLVGELEQLRIALREQAKTPEQDQILANVGHAELAAKAGDGPRTMQYLRSVGKWAFGIAASIGTGVAAAAIKAAIGI